MEKGVIALLLGRLTTDLPLVFPRGRIGAPYSFADELLTETTIYASLPR